MGNRFTRRGFLELGSAVLANAGFGLKAGAERAAANPEVTDQEASSSMGNIALEEHFTLQEIIEDSYAVKDLPPQTRSKILDLGSGRLADMDRGGLDVCILSLTAPGIQAVPDTSQAIALARRANDHLAENISKNSRRLKGFAALPMQDPQDAAQELTRCVKELGFCGALVNGFSQVVPSIPPSSTTFRSTVPSGPRFRTSTCRSIFIPGCRSKRACRPTRGTHGSPARPGDSPSKLRFTPFA